MICEQISACRDYKICYKKWTPLQVEKTINTEKENTLVRYEKTEN